jgi:hypothetical protein
MWEVVLSVTKFDFVIFVVTIIAYIILIVDIIKHDGISQNFFTWSLWAILDGILFITTYAEKATDLPIIAGCVLGSFFVAIVLLFVKKIKWTKNESWILSLVIITVFIWLWSESNVVGIISAVTAEILAGIPLMKASWKTPGSRLTLVSYLFFIISYVLSLFNSPNWDIENILFPLAFLIYSVGDTPPLFKKWIIKDWFV